jgi:hypothetical protein
MCSKPAIPFAWKAQQITYNLQNSQQDNKQVQICIDRWEMKMHLSFGDLNATLR